MSLFKERLNNSMTHHMTSSTLCTNKVYIKTFYKNDHYFKIQPLWKKLKLKGKLWNFNSKVTEDPRFLQITFQSVVYITMRKLTLHRKTETDQIFKKVTETKSHQTDTTRIYTERTKIRRTPSDSKNLDTQQKVV